MYVSSVWWFETTNAVWTLSTSFSYDKSEITWFSAKLLMGTLKLAIFGGRLVPYRLC
jgi:hypothetical protein